MTSGPANGRLELSTSPGAASARALAQAGAKLTIADLGTANLGAVAAALRDDGYPVATAVVDVTDEAQVEALVQGAVATRDVSAAGSYNVTWIATPLQGAQLWLIAVQ